MVTLPNTSRFVPRLFLLAPALLALLTSPPSRATLGGDLSTVKTDQAKLSAKLQVSPRDLLSVHEMKASTGTTVREFARPDGTVFAVTWEGPWRPDLRQLLGDYYADYQQAAKSRRPSYRGPISASTSWLVVEMGGHPRAFYGRAYAPDLVPSGVEPADIR